MTDLRWIKIKGRNIEDIFASYDFTNDSFKVEGFSGNKGVYKISGDLPENFPNPATVTYNAKGSGKFNLIKGE